MSIKVRISRLNLNPNNPVKAYASATLENGYAVHGLKVCSGQNGLFVRMPQNSYKKRDGTMGYRDVFHPTTADARAELNAKVLEAYQQKLAEDPSQAASGSSRNFGIMEALDPDDPFADFGPEPPFAMEM